MKRFQFSGESLLKWRTQTVEREDARLHVLFAEAAKLEKSLKDSIRSREIAAVEIRASATVSADDLRALDAFCRHTQEQEKAIHRKMDDCAKRTRDQQQRCLLARRDEQLLLKLKERRLHEWQYEMQKELDENASEAFLAKWNREERS
jgi:hypothetical protein